MDYKQYDIVIVNLEPTIGSEIKKTRPYVIVSPDEMNKYLRTITITPITSQSKAYPTRVQIQLEEKTNWVVIDQIRTIDKSRVLKSISKLNYDEITQVKNIIRETFVD